ncbi:MAG TPA: radical SAM family heme chaperone HemW [Terracidiphilus sp.]|jgi:oxygen-independent coproporphyrinogen-3 oxidase|nr:radical SAM family heme chaperone HemW [Terracidiphilus sp.]
MAAAKGDKLGLYLSIPFCRSKCTYCNFASGVYPASEHGRYVDRLTEDLRQAGAWAGGMGVGLPRAVDSVYLGGGTPSVLEPELIGRLFATLRAEFGVEKDAEITVECAPGQLSDGTLEALALAGVNRVSLGVQSFIDREAQVSGRLHKRAMVLDDLRRLRVAGITNLNLDLIAGLAGQTLASWDESLAVLIETGVPHASVYMLEVDEDSRLGREMLGGGARYYAELVPTDEVIAQMYETAIAKLEKAGLKQYEISNFARRGFESKHNLRYWERRPYLGVGLDASSALYAQEERARYLLRAKTTDELKEYLEGTGSIETGWLSEPQQQEEAWFLGLRLNRGVKIAALRKEFGAPALESALRATGQLVESGLVQSDGRTVRLTARGRLLSNEVFQEFLTAASEEEETRRGVLAAQDE